MKLMKNHAAFWQWAGYLSNPFRGTEIHAEMHPKKEREFRDQYFESTHEVILLSGKSAPFYVWKEGVNKFGKQLRVYFDGNENAVPDTCGFNVTRGRKQGGLRINSGDFVFHLFDIGFLLGKNTGRVENIKSSVPPKFKSAFDSGWQMMTSIQKMEMLVLDHYETTGNLTEKGVELQKLQVRDGAESADLLAELCKNQVLAENKGRNTYTLYNVARLRGEVESKSLEAAISAETSNAKREVLLEIHVRDRGWVKLAKSIFGDACMVDKCKNTFLKQSGDRYIETHHIKWLSDGGADHIDNLAMLCAHHHRMAHFAQDTVREKLRIELQRKNAACLKHVLGHA